MNADRVRLDWIEDHRPYDASYIDTWEVDDDERARLHAETARAIEDNGVWGRVAYALCPCCDEWKEVDSVWGFIGREPTDYDDDLRAIAMRQLQDWAR